MDVEPSSTAVSRLNRRLEKLIDYTPRLINKHDYQQAAVGLLLRSTSMDTEILFIERADNRHDPWSGQIAFPGGRRGPTDENIHDTVVRETQEETSVDLSMTKYLGRLDDQQGRSSGRPSALTVSCLVFLIEGDAEFKPNHEVADLFWCGISDLLNPAMHFEYQVSKQHKPYPAIRLDNRRMLWGLTRRFVDNLFEIIF